MLTNSSQADLDKNNLDNQSTEMNKQYEINALSDYTKINLNSQSKSMMLSTQSKLSKINEAIQFDVIGKFFLLHHTKRIVKILQ